MSVFGVTNNFYERELEKIEKVFGIGVISDSSALRVGI